MTFEYALHLIVFVSLLRLMFGCLKTSQRQRKASNDRGRGVLMSACYFATLVGLIICAGTCLARVIDILRCLVE